VELQVVGKNAFRTLFHHLDFSKDLLNPFWLEEHQESITDFASNVYGLILHDEVLPIKKRYHETLEGEDAADWDEESLRFNILKNHPLLCGTLAFRIRLEMQRTGLLVCNIWNTIIYPAHFCNALQQSKAATSPWILIDRAITIHVEDSVFIGGTPKIMRGCVK
jgi:hypothetical protein